MKKIIFMIVAVLIMALSMTTPLMAEEQAVLKVSGVVCSFCAQGIRKSFEQTETVKSVSVDLEKHEVTLNFQQGKNLPDSNIKQLLENSGYNLLEIRRMPAQEPEVAK